MYREALKCGWFDLTNARDTYRLAVGPEGLCEPLILRYIEVYICCRRYNKSRATCLQMTCRLLMARRTSEG